MNSTQEFLDVVRALYDNKNLSHLMDFCQGEMRTLYFLFMHENDEVIPSAISDSLNVSRSRTTATLSSLREKGMIVMTMAQDDRRKMLVSLTPKGKNYFAKRQQEAEAFVGNFLAKLGEENSSNLVQLLSLITETDMT